MDVADFMSGRLPVRRVWGLVERLLDEPWSRHRAKLLGGDDWRQHLGWGPGEYLQASLIDAVQVNTAVTAAHGSRQRPKVPPAYPRPGRANVQAEPLKADELPQLSDDELRQAVAMIND